jgi:hypothetical protein
MAMASLAHILHVTTLVLLRQSVCNFAAMRNLAFTCSYQRLNVLVFLSHDNSYVISL